jgi:hypothetical protein
MQNMYTFLEVAGKSEQFRTVRIIVVVCRGIAGTFSTLVSLIRQIWKSCFPYHGLIIYRQLIKYYIHFRNYVIMVSYGFFSFRGNLRRFVIKSAFHGNFCLWPSSQLFANCSRTVRWTHRTVRQSIRPISWNKLASFIWKRTWLKIPILRYFVL